MRVDPAEYAVQEIRRQNIWILQHLRQAFSRPIFDALNWKSGPSQLTQLTKDYRGSGPGADTARLIERVLGLPMYQLDQPPPPELAAQVPPPDPEGVRKRAARAAKHPAHGKAPTAVREAATPRAAALVGAEPPRPRAQVAQVSAAHLIDVVAAQGAALEVASQAMNDAALTTLMQVVSALPPTKVAYGRIPAAARLLARLASPTGQFAPADVEQLVKLVTTD